MSEAELVTQPVWKIWKKRKISCCCCGNWDKIPQFSSPKPSHKLCQYSNEHKRSNIGVFV